MLGLSTKPIVITLINGKKVTRHRILLNNEETHFYLDELVCPEIYFNKRMGSGSDYSLRYINPRLIAVLDLLRDVTGVPLIINNYFIPFHLGKPIFNTRRYAGLRDFTENDNNSLSVHYCGMAVDVISPQMDNKGLLSYILFKSTYFQMQGLTCYEDLKFTPTWLHLSVETLTESHKNFKKVAGFYEIPR